MTTAGIKDAMRRGFALLLLCTLVLAPFIIAATHGPGLPMDDAQVAEQLLHGHSHDEPEPGKFGGAHDATDHEHQTNVILPQTSDSEFAFGVLRLGMSDVSAGSLMPSGPRRPPRDMSV